MGKDDKLHIHESLSKYKPAVNVHFILKPRHKDNHYTKETSTAFTGCIIMFIIKTKYNKFLPYIGRLEKNLLKLMLFSLVPLPLCSFGNRQRNARASTETQSCRGIL